LTIFEFGSSSLINGVHRLDQQIDKLGNDRTDLFFVWFGLLFDRTRIWEKGLKKEKKEQSWVL
ncbi:hypothetical protein MTR67_014202, partial [Solanum verrucosum]